MDMQVSTNDSANKSLESSRDSEYFPSEESSHEEIRPFTYSDEDPPYTEDELNNFDYEAYKKFLEVNL